MEEKKVCAFAPSYTTSVQSRSRFSVHELRLPLPSVNSSPRYRFFSVYLDLCYHIFSLRLYFREMLTRTVLEQSELPDHRDLNVRKIHV